MSIKKKKVHVLCVNGNLLTRRSADRHHAAATPKTTWPQLPAVNERQLGDHNKLKIMRPIMEQSGASKLEAESRELGAGTAA